MNHAEGCLQEQKAVEHPSHAQFRHNVLKVQDHQQRQQEQGKIVGVVLHHGVLIEILVQKQRTVEVDGKRNGETAQGKGFCGGNALAPADNVNDDQQNAENHHAQIGDTGDKVLFEIVVQQFVFRADCHVIGREALVGICSLHPYDKILCIRFRDGEKMGIRAGGIAEPQRFAEMIKGAVVVCQAYT